MFPWLLTGVTARVLTYVASPSLFPVQHPLRLYYSASTLCATPLETQKRFTRNTLGQGSLGGGCFLPPLAPRLVAPFVGPVLAALSASRDSFVVKSARLMIEWLRVRIPAGAAGEFSSPASSLCADSHSVSVPPPGYRIGA